MMLTEASRLLAGRATAVATARYAERSALNVRHFRDLDGCAVSSVGIGTYLGKDTNEADAAYSLAIARAIELGCNFVDTAINYRHQRAERCVAAAVHSAISCGAVARDELVISTKAGYIPFDRTLPRDTDRYVREHYIETRLVAVEEIASGGHCIAPNFLRNQIERSRVNLGLSTIDCFYLHNVEEQLLAVGRSTFLRRLRVAMATLEEACDLGWIGRYGLATWIGFRETADHEQYLSLDEIVGLAVEVGGSGHHFRLLQLPFNLKAIEPYMLANQRRHERWCTLLDVAREHGIYVVTSSPLLQGRVIGRLPHALRSAFGGSASDAQCAVQFARSIPGVGTVLVGMGQTVHVEEIMSLGRLDPAPDVVESLFRSKDVIPP
jgi:aryl-alcohol dehydrogenase-like predicted oxidoreductase